jgi:hypothetical protein
MGKEHDALQTLLADFPEEAPLDIHGQIMSDINNYYFNNGDLSTKKYNLTSDYGNPNIAGFGTEATFVRSNNATNLDYCDVSSLRIKIYNKDNIMNSRNSRFKSYEDGANYNIGVIDSQLKGILRHEMGHYYLRQIEINNKEEPSAFDYHDDYGKYFEDTEELVMHSRDIWNKLKQINGLLEKDPVTIFKYIKRYVSSLPYDINYPYTFKKSTQKKYVDFIWKHYVKPATGYAKPKI